MLDPLVDAAAYLTCMCRLQYDSLRILLGQPCLRSGTNQTLPCTGSVPNGRGPELDEIKRQAQMHLQKSLAGHQHYHQQSGPAGAWPAARHASPLGGGSATSQSCAQLLRISELASTVCLLVHCLYVCPMLRCLMLECRMFLQL